MDYCHQHNLLDPDKENAEKKFGVKVSLPPGDPLTNLLGDVIIETRIRRPRSWRKSFASL
jgi:hypothetical protein